MSAVGEVVDVMMQVKEKEGHSEVLKSQKMTVVCLGSQDCDNSVPSR